MPPVARKSRRKKQAKDKDSFSRQTSLLDAFGLRSAASQAGSAASAAPSTAPSLDGSVTGDDVIDLPSSDSEPPLSVAEVAPSSPMTHSSNDGVEDTGNLVLKLQPGGTLQRGSSRDVPIVVADSSPNTSPVCEAKSLRPPPKAAYSIFAPRKQAGEKASPVTAVYGKPSVKPSVPFPDQTTQHVRGPQIVPDTTLWKYSRRERHRPLNTLPEDTTIYSKLASSSSTHPADVPPSFPIPLQHVNSLSLSEKEDHAARILTTHRGYPAIRRVLDDSLPSSLEASSSPNVLWSDRWRPRRADEVLGNEQSAMYLRDWLVTLKLHIAGSGNVPQPVSANINGKATKAKKKGKAPRGIKRPRIVRDVERKRRRLDAELEWIVHDYSDEDEDPLDIINMPDDDWLFSTAAQQEHVPDVDPPGHPTTPSPDDAVLPFTYRSPRFGPTVCNTILLTGPPGCGKTASVYACAEELGWDVFEVYPGIGERSGAALLKLIGEVGKSHLVRQTQTAPNQKGPTRNFFRKRGVVHSDNEGETPLDCGIDPHPESDSTVQGLPAAASEVSQSIVLVEEVDVLFREDASFWPALIRIIKECKRPVVLTCTVSLAGSYLRAICLSGNCLLDAAMAEELFVGATGPFQYLSRSGDHTLHPNGAPRPQMDLRRAISQLQLGIHTPSSTGEYASARCDPDAARSSLEKFRRVAWAMEVCSFTDSGLRRPRHELLCDMLSNIPLTNGDEVMGLRHFAYEPSDIGRSLPVTFSNYDMDETIYDFLLDAARPHYPHRMTYGTTPQTRRRHILFTSTLSSMYLTFSASPANNSSVTHSPYSRTTSLGYGSWFAPTTHVSLCINNRSPRTEVDAGRGTRSASNGHTIATRALRGHRDILMRTALGSDSPDTSPPSSQPDMDAPLSTAATPM
ncbi:P-loop containing nucleoside triphosphate hydrolase protein [Epithele typhae]|uniref:P-loop containing nucleoside triphosphate hydrolase protein n=1 Tax=Epithele typhae TaxID=378194 RepID=UPI00200760A1|nr:P-loop containing nucleoside triphosphate hydrolase protein [Epithele typhae]KAH9942325.1 P-loop containing nucleoside triphosphate hydrolase protein [Epithele typhae]